MCGRSLSKGSKSAFRGSFSGETRLSQSAGLGTVTPSAVAGRCALRSRGNLWVVCSLNIERRARWTLAPM